MRPEVASVTRFAGTAVLACAVLACAVLACAVLGCSAPARDATAVPEPDPLIFETDAYPILLADCGFVACHGRSDRFFQIYGPGRARLSASTLPHDPPTAEELAFSYTRAVSMLAGPEGIRASPLLRKPLAPRAGGAAHRGDDAWGASVYLTKRDPRWETLFFWAITGGDT
jgi:hypothetical protein